VDSADAKLIAQAKQEGSVTVYTVQSDQANTALTQEFTAKYGIQVNVVRLTDGPLKQRFAAEEQSGVKSADVIEVVGSQFMDQNPRWFTKFDSKDLAVLKNYPADDIKSTSAVLYVAPMAITYNTQLVPKKDVPKTWKDLLDSKWAGKILLTDPRASSGYMGWAEEMRKEFGVEYLQGLAKQKFQLVQSGGPGAQQVAAGAEALNFPSGADLSTALRQQGAPLGYVIPSDSGASTVGYSAIPSNAPHPAAARLWTDFRLSVDGQETLCKATEIGSPYPASRVPDCLKLPKDWHPSDYSVWDDQSRTKTILNALGLQ
jgi:ABC-type Fe3+ transport system substrate-binding protein